MIHRLQHNGDRGYGKARTVCGLDVAGQIHPLAERWTDRKDDDLELDLSEPRCAACYGAESPRDVMVHALHHGIPLCGYGEGKPPRDWPQDQAWLSSPDFASYRGPHVRCALCLSKSSDLAPSTSNALDHMREPKPSSPRPEPKRFEVWSIRPLNGKGRARESEVRVGRAIQNPDGSIQVELPDLGVKLRLKAT